MKILVLSLGLTAVLPCAACGKRVPASMKATLEAVRPEAEKIALAAAATCSAQYASGRFTVKGGGCSVNVLPGETLVPMVPSPAKGTPLESNPDVADVQTTCESPTSPAGANPSISCGSGLGSLHGLRTVAADGRGFAEDSCGKGATSCEQVLVPSSYSSAADAIDLRVVRPVAGGPPGSTVSVLVTLARK